MYKFTFLLLSLGAICFAGIVSITGDVVQITPPSAVTIGALESNTVAQVFAERTGVTLGAALGVNLANPGTFPPNAPGSLSPGTSVNSYYLHADSVGTATATWRGEIVFSETILGVAALLPELDGSAGVLGAPGTSYAGIGPINIGTDIDTFTISPDGRTLMFTLSGSVGADDMRIITATPEPSASLLIISGIAVLRYRRKRA